MQRFSSSAKAQQTLSKLTDLQLHFANQLSRLDEHKPFIKKTWLRDNGLHGGGNRLQAENSSFFNRAQINVSQVHFDSNTAKVFTCATALSTIIHPAHPQLPSIHIHISLTEFLDGQATWRVMADLNPSIASAEEQSSFITLLKEISGEYFQQGIKQGDQYFYIPALDRYRGVAHFYLESLQDNQGDFAVQFALRVIDHYIKLLTNKYSHLSPASEIEQIKQLDYHTLYLFQVLTLDKGTTAGILAHSQNDIGTLGSLPAYINVDLLREWLRLTKDQQQALLQSIIDLFPNQGKVKIDDITKQAIAETLRAFYLKAV